MPLHVEFEAGAVLHYPIADDGTEVWVFVLRTDASPENAVLLKGSFNLNRDKLPGMLVHIGHSGADIERVVVPSAEWPEDILVTVARLALEGRLDAEG